VVIGLLDCCRWSQAMDDGPKKVKEPLIGGQRHITYGCDVF